MFQPVVSLHIFCILTINKINMLKEIMRAKPLMSLI